MKFLKILLPIALAFCFTGCLDVNEKVDVKKDGSGQLTEDIDMSQMVGSHAVVYGEGRDGEKRASRTWIPPFT